MVIHHILPANVAIVKQQWSVFAKKAYQPVVDYFNKLWQKRIATVRVFEAARLFHPARVQHLQPTLDDIRNLQNIFPWVRNNEVQQMLTELPHYLALAAGTAANVNPMEWWPHHVDELPMFTSVVKRIALIAPTSAESERVFSILKSQIMDKQDAALEETLEATIMLNYNSRIND